MNQVFGHFGKHLSIYILLGVLSALMFYYVFRFVPDNEKSLNEHAMRLLDNKARSIAEKYAGYDNAINSAPRSYFAKWFFQIHPDTEFYLMQTPDGYYFARTESRLKEYMKSKKQKPSAPFFSPILIRRSDLVNSMRIDEKLRPEIHGTGDSKDIAEVASGNSYFVYSPKLSFYDAGSDLQSCAEVSPFLWMNTGEFMDNLKSSDFFDDLFIVRGPRTLKTQLVNDRKLLDHSSLGLVTFGLPDSAIVKGTGSYNTTLSGQPYKVYFKMVKLRRDFSIYAVGLVDGTRFAQEARSVPSWFVVFSVLVALVLVIILPALKLFLLNEFEKLSASDVQLAVYSVILSVCLVVTLGTGTYIFQALETENRDQQLCEISQQIADSTRAEIQAQLQCLQSANFEMAASDLNTKEQRNRKRSSLNEWFTIDSSGRIKQITLANNLSRDLDERKFPIDVSHRDYFRSIKIASDEKIAIDYAIQAISSFATGQLEVAVSAPDSLGGPGHARVITSRFPSFVGATIPSPYKFLIVNRDGDILFNSAWKGLRSENFVDESNKDPQLKAHFENDIDDFVDFTYLLRECKGYTRHVAKDWTLVVYTELLEARSLAAQVFSLCLVSVVVIVLFALILQRLLKMDYPAPILLKVRPFFYEWLNPRQRSAAIYWRLMLCNAFIFIYQILWVACFDSIVLSLLFTALTISASYMIVYKKLNSPETDVVSIPWQIVVMVICFVLFVVTAWVDGVALWALYLLPLAALLIITRRRSKNLVRLARQLTRTPGQFTAYRVFMFSWIFVLAVGPSMIFMCQHYRLQDVIRNYSFLINDIRSLQTESVSHGPATGMDYTDQDGTATQTSFKLHSVDMNFYQSLPLNYIVRPNVDDPRFGFLLNYKEDLLCRGPSGISVTSPKSRILDNSPTLTRSRLITPLRIVVNKTSLTILIIAIALMALLWFVITRITSKIFYDPGLNIDKPLPRRGPTLDMALREFEDFQDPKHPLYGILPSIAEVLVRNFRKELKSSRSPYARQRADEKFILALQNEADKLYRAKWEACQPEDRPFLYDLAEDGVTNQMDYERIRRLAKNGLVRLDPRLEVTNTSFANFVQAELTDKELADSRKEEVDQGRWQSAKVFLIILIIAAFGFLSIAEQNFFGRATALLGSITLVLPNIMNAIGAVTKLIGGKA